MKSLLVTGILLSFLATSLRAQAQTNATPASAPAPATTANTAKPDADAKPVSDGKPYPVTAIVVSNTITFPILLSKSSTPLMTNAVYRRTFGRKVIFAADITVQSFDIDKLHPSVIAQLDLDPTKVKSDQETLDKQNQEWAAQRQQQSQQFLAAESAALAKSQAAAQAQAASSTNGAATPAAAKTGHKRAPKGAPQTPPPAN